MPIPFSQTTRAMDADNARLSLWGLLFIVLLLGTWSTWFFWGEVTLYKVSTEAHLESQHIKHLLRFPASGKIAAILVDTGEEVEEGQILIELETSSYQIQIENKQQSLVSLQTSQEVLNRIIQQTDMNILENTSFRQTLVFEKERLRQEYASIENNMIRIRGEIKQLRHEIEKRQIKAPISGRYEEVDHIFRTGLIVAEGDDIGKVVPPNRLQIVALFAPDVQGHIYPGQQASFRFDGFPSAQYGRLSSTVEKVTEPNHDGMVEVEFTIHPHPNLRIPLQHGIPGVIEVATGKMSPALFVLGMAKYIQN